MDVDISLLRQQLPEYLARVRQGDSVRIVSRGRVVAELVPPSGDPDAQHPSKDSVARHDDAAGPALTDDESLVHRD
jgi:prevent-host-death family protein